MEGRCLCGAVTIRIGAHEPKVGACHCAMCRRWSGTVHASFDADVAGVVVAGPLRTYRSSAFAERAFCATCGSHLWMRDDEGPYELMPGLFDDAAAFSLASVVYADRAPAWMPLATDGVCTVTAADYEAAERHVDDP